MTEAVENNTNTENVPATEAIIDGNVEADVQTEANTEQVEAPIEYGEFTLPEGQEINKDMLDKFVPLFQEAKLPQEDAQKLVGQFAECLPSIITEVSEKVTKQVQEQVQNEFNAKVEGYLEATKKDPEIGGAKLAETTVLCARAIDTICGTPQEAKAFKEAMNEMGTGNHPDVVRFLSRVGKVVSEDAFHRGNAAGTAIDAATRLYGNTTA